MIAGHWATAFRRLGFRVRTVAGEGTADCLVPGLALDAVTPPDRAELVAALAGADLVVVENLCSLPLNPAAAEVLAALLRGRPAILHHHDLPWQRTRFAGVAGWPPDDRAWVHVTINELSRAELADRGIAATTVYGGFAHPGPGRRQLARARLEVADGTWLLLQPTRAIARKNVPAGVALAAALGADYWLTGPVEEGYGAELARVLAAATCRVHRRIPPELDMDDAYAAADAVVFPSSWEGFGAPLIESALHRRPLAVGHYPVVAELAAFGFRWFPVADPAPLRSFLERPEPGLLEANHRLAVRRFSIDALAGQLSAVLARAGWSPPGAAS